MQIVIDIPNEDYEYIKDRYDIDNVMVQSNLIDSIMNGKTLPKGHGRLIDADELKKYYTHDTDWEYPVNTNEYVNETIDNAPTIIEAESGE